LTLTPYRQHKRDAMVQSILEAARTIMREQGVAALSMQELARRMDLRAPSLYNYFSSKMDVYDALFRLGFSLYAQALEEAMQPGKTWQETLRASFETYLHFAQANPDLYQMCFERPVPGFTPSPASLQISLDLLNRAYQDVAQFAPQLRSELSPQQITNLVIAIMHGITAMHMANEPQLPAGEGRFGSLIPAALATLEKAWSPA
jgi:AcrR family transcriptional regulator